MNPYLTRNALVLSVLAGGLISVRGRLWHHPRHPPFGGRRPVPSTIWSADGAAGSRG